MGSVSSQKQVVVVREAGDAGGDAFPTPGAVVEQEVPCEANPKAWTAGVVIRLPAVKVDEIAERIAILFADFAADPTTTV